MDNDSKAARQAMTLEQRIETAFTYHAPNATQLDDMAIVRKVLERAAQEIAARVPDSPYRTRAIGKILDARMLANAAIVVPVEAQQYRND